MILYKIVLKVCRIMLIVYMVVHIVCRDDLLSHTYPVLKLIKIKVPSEVCLADQWSSVKVRKDGNIVHLVYFGSETKSKIKSLNI